MVQKNKQGLLVTFEGLDGSGKTTVIKEIQKWLDSLKIANVITREPGSSNPITSQIRSLVLDEKTPISAMSQLLLYSLDRRINLERHIWPALKSNKVVLCDRYLDSSLVYQGYAGQLGIDKVWEMQKFITQNTIPDLTFFLWFTA
ncbi:dTMP kinase [Mycoplasma sp. ATU-Cv-508]|uniref:dTMP kinase n=1 Tax=Mycoplasma sp. ATU-Cv-508 TaxID=2048001 RepID=UPI000FDED5E7